MEQNTSYRILPFSRSTNPSGFGGQEEILKAKLRLSTETTGIGLWEINLFTGEVVWDEQCKKIFGLADDSALTYEYFLSLLHPDDLTRVRLALRDAFFSTTNDECNLTYRIVDPKGPIHFLATHGYTLVAEIECTRRASRFLGT